MKARRGCLYYIERGLIWTGLALAALVLLGMAHQATATERDRRTAAPRGQLYSVNGRKMHLVCAGEGGPAIILQAGGGAESLWWYRVQDQLARHARVCAYDRPGHGWSESVTGPRDAHTLASELRLLLQEAGVAPPYIMVGHSYGALWARIYAAQYPNEVDGVVLVDSTFLIPKTFASQADFDAWKRSNDALKVLEWAAFRMGLVRLAAPGDFQRSGYPPEIAAEMAALRSPNWVFDADYQEQIGTRLAFTQAAAAAEDLGDRPLAVLWAGRSATARDYFRALRDETAAYSTNSMTRMIAGADHGSILGDPQHAQQVSLAILDVLTAARTGQPLAPAQPA